jgi:hypothetical protein
MAQLHQEIRDKQAYIEPEINLASSQIRLDYCV